MQHLIKYFNLPLRGNFKQLLMENDFRQKQRKSINSTRTIYHLTVAILLLAMAALMFFGTSINDEAVSNYVQSIDPLLRYMFGGLCTIYGLFRLYRGIKKEY